MLAPTPLPLFPVFNVVLRFLGAADGEETAPPTFTEGLRMANACPPLGLEALGLRPAEPLLLALPFECPKKVPLSLIFFNPAALHIIYYLGLIG
jgi:hypothetical protein